ncbi:DUF3137 domain-containing protein [Hwanghaeella grinnelliae]|uniref:DUF3137 domain-containing protein n=1 Tax=Hwanghaeella grinnelliae TaxID=2500179 RepID=A0A3S3UR99_9PROT|nr:DUF3137 domain-containing protein [Hwanghaeella grinnelliae]RVU38747.1 DUF3137 domain-containing protein [Hwanghaeella grinnelliae]
MTVEFKQFYKNRIAPLVEEAEAKTRGLRGKRRPLAAAVAGAWLVAAGAGIYALHEGQPMLVIIALCVFAVFGGLVLFGAIGRDGSAGFAKEFAGKIAALLTEKGFGGDFIANPDDDHVRYGVLADLGGLKKLAKPRLTYGLSGIWNGRAFRLLHLHSSSRGSYSSSEKMSGTPYHSVSFNGVVLEVDLPAATPAIVIRERDFLKDLLSKQPDGFELQDFTAGVAEFDDRFQVRTDNPDAAKDWITPEFARAFAAIQTDLLAAADTISAAFFEGRFYFSATRAGMNILSDLEPQLKLESVLSYEERAERAYQELCLPCGVLARLPLGPTG